MESTSTVQKTPLSRMRSFNGRDLSGLGLGVYLMADFHTSAHWVCYII